MAKNSMKPQIRFKGFTDAWEQRKFGELYRKVSRKNDLTYGETDIISVANMYYKVDSYITDNSYLLTYNVFHLGDIAFEGNKSKDFAHGRFVENTIGNGIVSHVFDVFEPIMASYDLMFWKYAINNERLMGPILVRSTKASTMMTNLVADDFLQEKFMLPSFEEQKLIGQLLFQVDNLITLHQRKYEKFVNIKKALLEKMFPQGDEKVPRIRFKGFTDAWEQREFKTLAKTRRGLTYNPNSISHNGIRVLRSSNINEDTFILSDEDVFVRPDVVKIECVKANDILITAANGSTRLVGKHAIIAGIRENDAVHGGFMLVASSTMPYFVNAAMSAPWYLKFISLFVAGGNGAIGNLNKNDLDSQILFVPRQSEQERIGDFFRNLDNLITLHQRQVEKLKNIKSALLEKMFV